MAGDTTALRDSLVRPSPPHTPRQQHYQADSFTPQLAEDRTRGVLLLEKWGAVLDQPAVDALMAVGPRSASEVLEELNAQAGTVRNPSLFVRRACDYRKMADVILTDLQAHANSFWSPRVRVSMVRTCSNGEAADAEAASRNCNVVEGVAGEPVAATADRQRAALISPRWAGKPSQASSQADDPLAQRVCARATARGAGAAEVRALSERPSAVLDEPYERRARTPPPRQSSSTLGEPYGRRARTPPPRQSDGCHVTRRSADFWSKDLLSNREPVDIGLEPKLDMSSFDADWRERVAVREVIRDCRGGAKDCAPSWSMDQEKARECQADPERVLALGKEAAALRAELRAAQEEAKASKENEELREEARRAREETQAVRLQLQADASELEAVLLKRVAYERTVFGEQQAEIQALKDQAECAREELQAATESSVSQRAKGHRRKHAVTQDPAVKQPAFKTKVEDMLWRRFGPQTTLRTTLAAWRIAHEIAKQEGHKALADSQQVELHRLHRTAKLAEDRQRAAEERAEIAERANREHEARLSDTTAEVVLQLEHQKGLALQEKARGDILEESVASLHSELQTSKDSEHQAVQQEEVWAARLQAQEQILQRKERAMADMGVSEEKRVAAMREEHAKQNKELSKQHDHQLSIHRTETQEWQAEHAQARSELVEAGQHASDMAIEATRLADELEEHEMLAAEHRELAAEHEAAVTQQHVEIAELRRQQQEQGALLEKPPRRRCCGCGRRRQPDRPQPHSSREVDIDLDPIMA